jgi:hypothetical protein
MISVSIENVIVRKADIRTPMAVQAQNLGPK